MYTQLDRWPSDSFKVYEEMLELFPADPKWVSEPFTPRFVVTVAGEVQFVSQPK